MKYGVFISYSHEDKHYISPLVELIRAMRSDFVFLDYDSIQKGKQWRHQIESALLEVQIIIVFWCRHSAASIEVQKEYEIAIQAGKDILPILLDDTHLIQELAIYQGIDFRKFRTHLPTEPDNFGGEEEEEEEEGGDSEPFEGYNSHFYGYNGRAQAQLILDTLKNKPHRL